MGLTVTIKAQSWPLASAFVISRGSKTEANVVVAEIRGSDTEAVGRGECVPYARYGETADKVIAQIEEASRGLAAVSSDSVAQARRALQTEMKPGAARNALDCALWDYEAKSAGVSIWGLTGLGAGVPLLTAYTLSLDTPDAMAAAAVTAAHLPLLKLKLGGVGDDARLRAIRKVRPDARLIADANEAWTDELLQPLLEVALETGVELIEQPLPAGHDEALRRRPAGVLICADESLHTREDLAALADRYDAINIKLDKAGGLTEALALAADARDLNMQIMVGCMVGTSLAMAPALMVAHDARWVDLDGPLLLARDRDPGLSIANGMIQPARPALWG
jgi:L-Ala-D/L-Glu epimerase